MILPFQAKQKANAVTAPNDPEWLWQQIHDALIKSEAKTAFKLLVRYLQRMEEYRAASHVERMLNGASK